MGADHGELERHQNRRQAVQKSTARVERGYYVTRAPMGYRYEYTKHEGAKLVPNEPFASIVREALEGFASRRFELQAEVQRFLESHPQWPRNRSGKRARRVNENRVTAMLSHPAYAGLVSAPYWGVSQRKGVHEPLISLETHHRILARLKGDKRAPARRDLNADFALRGFVHCSCGSPLTASWSKGRNAEYPYYLCANRAGGCAHYGKSIRRDVIEDEFEALLKTLEPSESLFRTATRVFQTLWEDRRSKADESAHTLRSKLHSSERQIGRLLDRIVETSVPEVITAYERNIAQLHTEKLLLAEKVAQAGAPMRSFEDALRTALTFLSNPWKLWASGRLDYRRTLLKLAFTDNLQYARNQGFRTADLALPFKMLADFSAFREGMVDATGIEPVTPAV